jgi:hypothetical protein
MLMISEPLFAWKTDCLHPMDNFVTLFHCPLCPSCLLA